MRIITYFDNSSWAEYGEAWSDKENDNVVALCSESLGNSHKNKVSKTFSCVHYCDCVGSFYDLCNYSLSILGDHSEYLLCSPRKIPPFNFLAKKDAYCFKKQSNSSSFDVTNSIVSIANRAEAVKIIESVVGEVGSVLDSSFIWGTADFWIGFVGFQRCLKKSEYAIVSDENFGDLVLSLFYKTSSSFSLEVG